MNGHYLLSCYYCGGWLRFPTKDVAEPLRGDRVTVCNGQCGAGLYRLGLKIERNARALANLEKT